MRRATRRQYSAEEKIRIVVDGLRGEDRIAELCRREGIAQSLYYTSGQRNSWKLASAGWQVIQRGRRPRMKWKQSHPHVKACAKARRDWLRLERPKTRIKLNRTIETTPEEPLAANGQKLTKPKVYQNPYQSGFVCYKYDE
jgi:transposase-like protein